MKKNSIQDWVEAILFAFVVAMVIRNYTFQNFKIPSSSMESTLLIGDYLVANKLKYFFEDPKREDIVTFRYPADPIEPEPRDNFVKLLPPIYWNKTTHFFTYYAKKNVVKRVIGMPGDTVEVRDKQVYINHKPFIRKYAQFIDPNTYPRYEENEYSIRWANGQFMGSRDNFGPVIVPKDCYFAMGDNRDVSADSRYWGFLERKDITGTPMIIFFSVSEDGEKRWDRVFKLVK